MFLLKCLNISTNVSSIVNKKSSINTFENDCNVIYDYIISKDTSKKYSYELYHDELLPTYVIYEHANVCKKGWVYNTKSLKKVKLYEISLCSVFDEFTCLFDVKTSNSSTQDNLCCDEDKNSNEHSDETDSETESDKKVKKYEYMNLSYELNDYINKCVATNVCNNNICNIYTQTETYKPDPYYVKQSLPYSPFINNVNYSLKSTAWDLNTQFINDLKSKLK